MKMAKKSVKVTKAGPKSGMKAEAVTGMMYGGKTKMKKPAKMMYGGKTTKMKKGM